MKKTLLVTGATDGIGLEAAKILASKGHNILLHGRNAFKLENAVNIVSDLSPHTHITPYLADFADIKQVEDLAKKIIKDHENIDVCINNAGILKTSNSITKDGFDIRFMVNTIAPYLLTKMLYPSLSKSARIINLSSAAQNSVDFDGLSGKKNTFEAMSAYAQSKLAITMWSRQMAQSFSDDGPLMISVNPGSLLASKMVKEGFGIHGKDIMIGANILVRLSLDAEFSDKNGQYFDNDAQIFSDPHPDVFDENKCKKVIKTIENVIVHLLHT